jgi:hypothetical protein
MRLPGSLEHDSLARRVALIRLTAGMRKTFPARIPIRSRIIAEIISLGRFLLCLNRSKTQAEAVGRRVVYGDARRVTDKLTADRDKGRRDSRKAW